MRKNRVNLFLIIFALIPGLIFSQTYRKIQGFSEEINQKLEIFLNSTSNIKDRKVAVFDCDGTLLGQVPFYLSEEAIYSYAEKIYINKKDNYSIEKMRYIEKMIHPSNEEEYLQNTLNFLAGMKVEEVEQMGIETFHQKYQNKIYPQMKDLLENLKEYGFEIWIITASAELIYQKLLYEELGIPKERIIGLKSVINEDGYVSNKIIPPYPQEKGKVEAIRTYIKTQPLIVGGNSRGDMEMMNFSKGFKIIVNPDNTEILKGDKDADMKGYTVKGYWEKDANCIAVYCDDILREDIKFISGYKGINPNKEVKQK